MFWTHEPVSPRQDAQWLIDMRRDLRPHQYVRMVENRFTTGDASFIDLAKWDACVDPEARPLVADKELPVVVGIDAAVKHDSTAIVACAWDEDAKRVRLVWHRVFQPTPTQHLDFEGTIESTLLDLRQRFLVKRVLYDPYQMAATSQRLTRAGLRIEEFQQSLPNLTKASQNLFELINGRNIVLYPDAAMRLAISRAVAKESARGWLITKEKQSHKIDVVVALGMAALAAVQSATIVPEHVPMVPPLIYSPLSGWSDEGARPQSAHAAWARQYYGGSDRFAAIGGRTSPIVPGSRRREW